MDKFTQLQQRIEALEKKNKDLEESSSIPINFDSALVGRGFLKSNTLFCAGRVAIGGAGVSRVPIPGASAKSIAFATDAVFPASGVEAYIEFSVDHYELHLEGTATTVVNFVVFYNNDNNFKDLT